MTARDFALGFLIVCIILAIGGYEPAREVGSGSLPLAPIASRN